MARSLRNGDYALVLAMQSSSNQDTWYRVLCDQAALQRGHTILSCDCPRWTYNGQGDRTCKHTRLATRLFQQHDPTTTIPRQDTSHPYIGAMRTQWPMLQTFVESTGWGVQEYDLTTDHQYLLVLIEATSTTQHTATAAVVFDATHASTPGSRAAPVAGWGGYALAAAFCQQAGVPLTGEPPVHYTGTRPPRRRRGQTTPTDILQIGNQTDLGDGLQPIQRAENTLRMFLGAQYPLLEHQGFLDVSSARYPGRVYRLRRDPERRWERRIRVFEEGRYQRDFCVVRAQQVPEADHFMTLYFGLIADESRILAAVQRGNIFRCHSDGDERETVPAIWRPRTTTVPAVA